MSRITPKTMVQSHGGHSGQNLHFTIRILHELYWKVVLWITSVLLVLIFSTVEHIQNEYIPLFHGWVQTPTVATALL